MMHELPQVGERRDHRFTRNYSQPTGYHFCLDSVILAEQVVERLSPFLPPTFHLLDIGAGCGIVGLEILFYRPDILRADFLEVQTEFSDYFFRNLHQAQRPEWAQDQWIEGNFKDLNSDHYKSKYDLIVANPPYFFSGEGLLGKSKLQNRARFFLDATLDDFIFGMQNALKPGGTGYFLLRPGYRHGRNVVEYVQKMVDHPAFLKPILSIRGTWMIEMKKP